MPSVSKAQQRFMGLVHAYKKGDIPASQVSKAVKDAAKSMKKKSAKDFASTKHDDLPNKVREYLMSENPAASAAAAMAMMKLQNPSTGQKVSAVTPLRDKDHPLHKKSKSIFQRLKDKFMKKNESVNEDGHTDVASIERKLKLIVQDANDVINALKSKSNEDSLPSWWTDKITLAKDYVGKSRDYIMNPAESVNEDITSAGYYFLRKAAYSIGVALKDLNKGIKKQEDKRVLPEVEYIYDKATEMKKMMKNKRYNESVNEGNGVEKILKMADEKSFGKIAGRTVDGMTAGLFKAVYDKAPQNAKDKIDKMSEKQLYVFMGKLWNKFGRQVKLS